MKEQKMKESPELEELFRGRNNVKCTDNDLRSVIGERLKEGNKITNKKRYFCGIGNAVNPEYVTAFLINDWNFSAGLESSFNEFQIVGFSRYNRCVYDAQLEQRIVGNNNKLRICTIYVSDGNEHHGIGSAGVQIIADFARLLGCKEIRGNAESYLNRTEEGEKRLQDFYKKNGFVFEEDDNVFRMKL